MEKKTHPFVAPAEAVGSPPGRDARAGDAEEGVEQRGDSTPVAKLASPDLEGVVLEREGGVHWGEDALGGGARAGKKGNHGVILCAQGGLMTGKRVLGGGSACPPGNGGEEGIGYRSGLRGGQVQSGGGVENEGELLSERIWEQCEKRAESENEVVLE